MLLFLAGLLWGTGMQPHGKESVEYYSEVYDTPELIPEPETEIVDSNGRHYELSEQEIEDVPITGRAETVSSEILYEGVRFGETIPEQADIKVWDEESKKNFHTELPLFEARFSSERWEDDFVFEVTLHTYGADIYVLGEREIPKENEGGMPALGSCEADLLALIGMSSEHGRIEDYQWSGEPYTDEAGILCRDVQVSGLQKVSDCAAIYKGVISMPDYKRYRLRTNYIRTPEKAETLEAATPSEADFANTSETEPREVESLWDKLIKVGKICLQISVGLGCILLAFIGFRFLLFLAGKVDEKRKGKKR